MQVLGLHVSHVCSVQMTDNEVCMAAHAQLKEPKSLSVFDVLLVLITKLGY